LSQAAHPSTAPSFTPPDVRTPASFLYYYVVYLAIVLIPTVFLLSYFLVVVPPFKEIFKDFKTTLPPFTEWTIYLAYLVRSGLWVLIVLAALVLPLLPASITVRQPYRFNRVAYVLIAVILMLTFNMICGLLEAAALFQPLIKLIQSVSGGENGG
jgi:type II secretory pathway component PulF